MEITNERVIYKYNIKPGGQTFLRGWFTDFLDVGVRGNDIALWVEVALWEEDERGRRLPRGDKNRKEYSVWTVGTGIPYNRETLGDYFKSVKMTDGMIWHIFLKEIKYEDDKEKEEEGEGLKLVMSN